MQPKAPSRAKADSAVGPHSHTPPRTAKSASNHANGGSHAPGPVSFYNQQKQVKVRDACVLQLSCKPCWLGQALGQAAHAHFNAMLQGPPMSPNKHAPKLAVAAPESQLREDDSIKVKLAPAVQTRCC